MERHLLLALWGSHGRTCGKYHTTQICGSKDQFIADTGSLNTNVHVTTLLQTETAIFCSEMASHVVCETLPCHSNCMSYMSICWRHTSWSYQAHGWQQAQLLQWKCIVIFAQVCMASSYNLSISIEPGFLLYLITACHFPYLLCWVGTVSWVNYINTASKSTGSSNW
jgi:hypothetical protein